ncbi:hypothetical protein Pan44_14700 [Caulifigura coniformis]|uniref:Uncharacterized protein n=1 Tax=Caulifigura coniformis TaxID=2527983 RepID=A0A517SBE6_9PLAN|nr:hypothetical protein [Caulifigura coniformis]QDT53453.1 hypothetical protein Pan44_14700 [Caulifigura coniformis]
MPAWLNKASNVFRRNTPEVEHPFAVPCECGLVHRGMRRNRHQKIVCRECGATRFVLPKDVYPAPKNRPAEPAAPPAALPVLNPTKEPAGRRGKSVGRPEKPSPKAARDAAPEFFVVPASGRLVTPFRIVVVSIAAVALITTYLTVQKVRRDAATTALRESTDAAWAAVKNRDWRTASEQFELATAAVTTLGRRDSTARRLESGLRESRTIDQLSPKSLLEILAEADATSADADKWKRQFQTHYEGRWLVFDGPVDRKQNGWQVSFPVTVGKRNRIVRVLIDSAAFDDLKESDGEQGVILAARLAGCELSDNKNVWNVTFEPDSGFLWSLPETFDALGIDGGEFRSPDQTKDLLTRQAEQNGILSEVTP